MSPTLKSTYMGGSWAKSEEEKLTGVSHILTRSWTGRDVWLSYAKEIVPTSSDV